MIERMTRRRLACLAALLVIPVGWVGSSVPQPAVDSREGVPLAINPTPRLTIGVVDGDSLREFHEVVTPFLLADGSVAVPLAGAGVIRTFDQRGVHLRSHGRTGEGPGEFRRIGGALSRADTIEVVDLVLQRITQLHPSMQPRVIKLTGPRVTWLAGAVSDGWMLLNTVQTGDRRDNGRDIIAAYWYDRSGRYRADAAKIDGIKRFILPGMVAAEAFSPSARFAVYGDHIYVGDTLVPEVLVRNQNGQILRTIRWQPDDRGTPAQARSRIQRAPPIGVETAQELDVRRRLLEAPLPDRLPVFSDLLVDAVGYVWVRAYVPDRDAVAVGGKGVAVHLRDPGGTWRVFAPDGSQVASIEMPKDLEPSQITASAVVGVTRDEFGVEQVRVHALTRR